jgi:hypothetical protein
LEEPYRFTYKKIEQGYVIRNVKPYMSTSALKAISYSFFHSLMGYGINFWGNSSHSSTIFLIQKNVIRIMLGCGNRISCRHIFKELEILPLASQCYQCLYYKTTLFPSNLESHITETKQRQNLYRPQANLTIYQNGVHYAGIKVFNKLPIEIKNTCSNLRKFKAVLKHFLNTRSFYTIDEYLM